MRRTEYRCPHCTQTSSRRWNLKTHMQRRHSGGGIGQPIKSELSRPSSDQAFPNIRNSLYDSNFGYAYDNNNYFHAALTGYRDDMSERKLWQ